MRISDWSSDGCSSDLPIDGTRAFIEGKPEFTVCVALMDDNRPVLGAIFNPATNEFFEAAAGGGTRLNGKVIHASDRKRVVSGKSVYDRVDIGGGLIVKKKIKRNRNKVYTQKIPK